MIRFKMLVRSSNKGNLKKFVIVCLFCMQTTGCLNENKLSGERQEIYTDPVAKYLDYKGKKISLSKPQKVVRIHQVDNGPTHHFIHATFSGSIVKAWETSVLRGGNLSAPVITEKNIFVLDGQANLVAFDLTGKTIWATNLVPETEGRQYSQYSGGLAVYGDSLFALTGYGEIISLDKSKGSILWRQKFDSPFRGAPVIKDKRLYSVTSNDLAVAMTLEGKILWTLEGATRSTVMGKGSAPAASSGKVFLPFSAGILRVVRSSNGSEIWKESFGSAKKGDAQSIIGDFGGSPLLKSGKVFIVSISGQLLALNARNGSQIWQLPIGSQSTPLIAGGFLFIVSSSGELVRINESTGEIVWSRLIERKNGNKNRYFGPTLAGNYIWITGTDGRLRKFDPVTGTQVEDFYFRSPALYRPYAAHSKLFVVTRSGKLIAFD